MMRSDSRGAITFGLLVVVVAFCVVVALTYPKHEPAPVEPTVSLAAGKEMAKAISIMNHYVWPDGAIIHKRLGNGWVCVEIDGHHLLVHNRGNSTFGVAVDSCIEE